MSPRLATVSVTLPWLTLLGETATLKSLRVTVADFEPAEALETMTTTTTAATMRAPSATRARRGSRNGMEEATRVRRAQRFAAHASSPMRAR